MVTSKHCVKCKRELPYENKGYSVAHATPLTCGAQSSLLYYSQLLFYQVYQLRLNEKSSEKQSALNLGLIRTSVEMIEGMFDQILVMAMQFRFMSDDYCKSCGIEEIDICARISNWDSYKNKFDELFPKNPIKNIFLACDLEALNMLFLLRHHISHCQPLRASLLPNEDHITIIDDLLGRDHKKLLAYLKKQKVLDKKYQGNEWTWDVLLQDSVFVWAIQTARICVTKLSIPNSFPHWEYVKGMSMLSVLPDIKRIQTITVTQGRENRAPTE